MSHVCMVGNPMWFLPWMCIILYKAHILYCDDPLGRVAGVYWAESDHLGDSAHLVWLHLESCFCYDLFVLWLIRFEVL